MRTSHERAVYVTVLLAGLPGVALGLALLFSGSFSRETRITLALLVVIPWLALAAAAMNRVVRPLQTIANLLSALREGDTSIRGRGARRGDALGEALIEMNALAQAFRDQRLGAVEATALLKTVMTEIDVAVFAFDAASRLKLANRAGERLLGQPSERLLGRTAEELSLGTALAGKEDVLSATFPGGAGRWGVRRSVFRQEGERHTLLVLADLSKPLREEERQAWQRLIRVLGHELNNSLAPITSVAGSLTKLVERTPRPADFEDDVRRGLAVIAARASSLKRFLEGYSRLARLPSPRPAAVEVGALVRRAAALETRVAVAIAPGPDVSVRADADQLEQLLINLLKNAAEAALETGGGVTAGWTASRGEVEIFVDDEGPGLAETSNLFVPFFTTKRDGSGIGLVLSRQIAEAHGGSVRLANRPGATGCRASVLLPLARRTAGTAASRGAL
ncbi:MAG TPA: ATP-binding protein [Thermoanaerobaculia bacterium]|nr:ATP-binding protein [Thermoanaerobaculia bacterium]